MAGESGQQHGEPSFSEAGLDDIGDDSVSAPVDLDRLLEEIDRSSATSSSPDSGRSQERRDNIHTEVPEHEEFDAGPSARKPPGQSVLDFGEVEPPFAGARMKPLRETSTTSLNGEESMSQRVLMAGGALVALSLLCGVVGLFVGYSASGKIEALQLSVDSLQSKLATMQVSGDPRVGQLQAEQAGITSRLDELVMRLDEQAAGRAPASAQLAELRKRLDTLERKSAQSATTKSSSSSTKSSGSKPAPVRGDWTVVLVSYPTSAQAESEKTRLRKLGIRAEIIKSQIDGKTWYRIRVPDYESHDSAKAAIPGIESKSGIKGAWVAKR